MPKTNYLLKRLTHGLCAVLALPTLTLTTYAVFAANSTADAAACGGANQRPCKIWERVPSCDRGLVEDFRKGRCVAKTAPKPLIGPRPTTCGAAGQKPCPVPHVPSCNGRLVEDFAKGICRQSNADIVNMAKDTISQSGDLIRETAAALGRCSEARTIMLSGAPRASIAGQLLRTQCVMEMIEGARRAGYPSFSLGVGGGVALGIGGDVEGGFVFDTAHANPPTFYTSYGFSLGVQAGGGGNLVAGYGRSANLPGKSQGHGASIGLAAVGGGGASSWYNYDGSPDGISVVATVGGKFSAAYGRNETHIIAIPGANAGSQGAGPAPGPVPAPGPTPEPGGIMVSGNYYFASDPTRTNAFRMANANLLQATNQRNGSPSNWHDYVRLDATTFKARNSTATYAVQPNGDLLWKSNQSDNKHFVLRRQ